MDKCEQITASWASAESPLGGGFEITTIADYSPAAINSARGGLRVGDVIVKIRGASVIRNKHIFGELCFGHPSHIKGEPIEVQVWRKSASPPT